MEDYHVDRLGVEVWWHMKLTSTNNSNELYWITQTFFVHLIIAVILWSGGYGEGRTLDSIPNSVVKTFSADGTLS